MARRKSKTKPLSDKARAFAVEYIPNGCNGTAAAIAAGYSKKSARCQASQLLADPRVQEIISEKARHIEGQLEGEALDVFNELWNIAMASPEDLEQWPDRAKLAVKLKALEKLGDFYELVGPQQVDHRHEVKWSLAIGDEE